MRAEFAAKRPQYDSLLALALPDTALWRVAPSWYRTRAGVNRSEPSALLAASKWDVYRHFFARLDLANGVSIDTAGVLFHRSDIGIVGSASSKAFAYVAHPSSAMPRCATLDSIPESISTAHGECYHEIGVGWYLYLDW